MTQNERIQYLIETLVAENPRYKNRGIPDAPDEQWRLLRSLMNVRPAAPISEDFLIIQDEYLNERIAERGIVDAHTLPATASDPLLVVWKGDISTLPTHSMLHGSQRGGGD